MQYQPDGDFYDRFFSEITLYLRLNKPAHRWLALLLCYNPSRSAETAASIAFRPFMELPQLRRVYLVDYRDCHGLSETLGLIRLIASREPETIMGKANDVKTRIVKRNRIIMRSCAVIVMAMAACLWQAQAAETTTAPQWHDAELKKGYVVFEYTTLDNLPGKYVPSRQSVTGKVSTAMAQGEYNPLQIGVHALANSLSNIKVTVGSDIDVTVYHRIEPTVKQQLILDEEMANWYPNEIYLQRGDAFSSLSIGDSINFWLTFHAKADAKAGMHCGKIQIDIDGRPATTLDLSVEVRPFQLASARIPFGMYWREDFNFKRFGGFGLKDEVTLAIYRDMAVHSQNSVYFVYAGDFSKLPPGPAWGGMPLLQKRVALAQEAGLAQQDIPAIIDANIAGLPKGQKLAVAEWLQVKHRENKWPEMMEYGWDEPPYPAPGMRETYTSFRNVPIRLGTSMSSLAAYAYGDIHDACFVIGGEITPEMTAEHQRRGTPAWTYSYRIWREEFKPLRQRYYAGLYTWAYKLEGNLVWAYNHGHHAHAWFMPGGWEPMPVTGWEARRDGVNDYRYLQMLEDAVASKQADPLAIEAAAWINTLRSRLIGVDPHLTEAGKPLGIEEYEQIRATATNYIVRLGVAPTAKPKPVAYLLKDEAASFRGKSVAQCIDGLRKSDIPARRSAAWALFETGPDAAAAIPELIWALDDAEVRIPAMRALESIGAQANSAVPKLTSFLSHPDAYVRLGAILTLTNIVRPASWNGDVNGYASGNQSPFADAVVPGLRTMLRTKEQSLVAVASLGLFFSGEASLPALPEAMKLIALGNDGLPRDDGSLREFGMQILAGLGSGATGAVPLLIKAYDASKGSDAFIALTLAGIGPAAADAIGVLGKYRTPENHNLAEACYALISIRGNGEEELKMLAGILGDPNRTKQEWAAAARFLIALGTAAAPVESVVRERLPLLLPKEPSIKKKLEDLFFLRIKEGGKPLFKLKLR
ncbi:MAG: DUF2887 domain-containing protein [Methylococcaceae bacterium]